MKAYISISQIRFDEKIYPRISPTDEFERYSELLKEGLKFPPITVDQNYRLLDGFHRMEAHKKLGLDKIEAEIRNVRDDYEALCIACQLNATQGIGLSKKERRENAIKLYKMACNSTLPSQEEAKKIALSVGISLRTLYRWTQEIREKWQEIKKEKIKELKQQGLTQKEIADKVGLSQKTISNYEKAFTKQISSPPTTTPVFDLNTRRGIYNFMKYLAENAEDDPNDTNPILYTELEEFLSRNRRFLNKILAGLEWFDQLAVYGLGMLAFLTGDISEDPKVKKKIKTIQEELIEIIELAITETEKKLFKFKRLKKIMLKDEIKDPLLETVKDITKKIITQAISYEAKV